MVILDLGSTIYHQIKPTLKHQLSTFLSLKQTVPTLLNNMKLGVISLLVLASTSSLVEAKNCKKGLDYCGYVLLRRGNYYAQIANELKRVKKPTDSHHVQDSLFHCTGGANGAIRYKAYCSAGCSDGGDGKSDSC